jgi:molecular chaperone DnaK
MVKVAAANAAADKKRRGLVEARNHAEGLIHTTERSLSENEGKVPADDKQAAEQAMAALKTAMATEDAADIEAKTQALTQVSMKIGEALYKAQGDAGQGGAEGGPGAGGPGADGRVPGGGSDAGKGNEKVVDADFEEVDEDKGKKAS